MAAHAPGTSGGNPSDWREPPKRQRDPKRIALVLGLVILSWVATLVGMLELIEANVGTLPITHKVIVAGSVAMLMTMIVWLLDQLFAPNGAVVKLLYLFGYVFLSIISIGFGFGFYWKVLESRSEGTRSAEAAIVQVQAPLQTAALRMETLQRTLDQLKTTSQQKAEVERTQGTSCPNSRPGDGPRRKLRDDDAARFSFASDFVKPRIQSARDDIAAIEGDLAKLLKADPSLMAGKDDARAEFLRSIGRRLDQTVTAFNAFRSDPQLRQIRTELAERAEKTQFIDTQGKPYTCPDQGLATMVRSVVASIDALPQLEKAKIANVEGSDATIEAFRRLTATFAGLLAFKLPPSPEELRELQKKAVAQAESGQKPRAAAPETAGLSQRDYIPLAIAVFVDLCLLLVSIDRRSSRLGGLVGKMREAERGPVIEILSRFNEIHRDRQIRENFELFRHVVFDLNGDYYAAVPLDAPPRMNPQAREDLRLEALLLANLFTGFEKERIFNRVLLPYITTRQIQKRLWKQGSKFAHSESFRLYKFRDGAWSEIILGAIMGAARKVEAERATGTTTVTRDPFELSAPSFGEGGPTVRPDAGPVPGVDPRRGPVVRSQAPPTWYMPPPAPINRAAAARPTDAEIADLAEHKRRLAEAAEVQVTQAANSNTAPAATAGPATPAADQAGAPATSDLGATAEAAAEPTGRGISQWNQADVPAIRTVRLEPVVDTATGAAAGSPLVARSDATVEPDTDIAINRIADRFRPEAQRG